MTSKQAFRGGLAVLAGMALCTAFISPATSQQSKLRIIQTNSAGDNVHIIDAATNKVVGEIKGIEAPHGITVSPDGSRIYIEPRIGRHTRRRGRQDDAGDQTDSFERESEPCRRHS